MKIIIAAATIIALLMGAPAVYASTDLPHAKDPQAAYQAGYSHGIATERIAADIRMDVIGTY